MIVVDTQVCVYAAFGSGPADIAMAVRDEDSAWAAPLLWRSEFRSAAVGMVRNQLLDEGEAAEGFALTAELLGGREHLVDTVTVLRLAAGNRITAYDLEFVAVAKELGVTLVTFDKQVLAAFPEVATHPAAFLAS